ncbi:unnamed protein product [Lepeophtheirus salmonis]|uniref:(salmon louse) hypothetical protein n=1 Tax=Lepeophtheirus salmonis TaxID=72036 RepID=A0A7R8CUK3_LEPSM|nr:unnamed protein product [Lepeophtheirus salmonis]CAF2937264.1 unnamed protein product [Lepeophtheirus salmonis]
MMDFPDIEFIQEDEESTQEIFVEDWRWQLNIGTLTLSVGWLVISGVFNIVNFLGVICSGKLRRVGYFHVLLLFNIFHVLYFFNHVGYQVFWEGRVDHFLYGSYPSTRLFKHPYSPFTITNTLYETELVLLGTEFYFLTALTFDVFLKSFRPRKNSRINHSRCGILLFAIIFNGCVMVIVITRRFFPHLLNYFGLRSFILSNYLIGFHIIALVVFILIPGLLITLLGATNWVRTRASTYPISVARRRMNSLDTTLWILNSFTLLCLLGKVIVNLAIQTHTIDLAYRDFWTVVGITLLYESVPILLGFYPIVICFKIAGTICCKRNK